MHNSKAREHYLTITGKSPLTVQQERFYLGMVAVAAQMAIPLLPVTIP